MVSPEYGDQCKFVIAGGTSMGKTRTLMETSRILREGGHTTAILSAGDVFRYLAQHERIPWYDPDKAIQDAATVLADTQIEIGPDGRITLIDKGRQFEQDFTNGHNAADISPFVEPLVVKLMDNRIEPALKDVDVIGIDGRMRWFGAPILVRVHASDDVRVGIHEIERPEVDLTPRERLEYILGRDLKDARFWKDLEAETHNVVDVIMREPTDAYITHVSNRLAHVIADYSSGAIPPSFGTIEIS